MDDERQRARIGRHGRRHERPPVSRREAMRGADRVPDALGVRAKSTGHRKKIADKWNQ